MSEETLEIKVLEVGKITTYAPKWEGLADAYEHTKIDAKKVTLKIDKSKIFYKMKMLARKGNKIKQRYMFFDLINSTPNSDSYSPVGLKTCDLYTGMTSEEADLRIHDVTSAQSTRNIISIIKTATGGSRKWIFIIIAVAVVIGIIAYVLKTKVVG